MLKEIQDSYQYLRYPVLLVPRKPVQPVRTMLVLWLLTLSLAILASVLDASLKNWELIPRPELTSTEAGQSRWAFLFGALLFGPVLEELSFRLQLRYFSTQLLFLAFLCGAIFSALTGTYWAYLVSPFFFLLFYGLYRFNLAGSIGKKHRFRTKTFPFYFHFTALAFAFFHLDPATLSWHHLPFVFLYTLPQLVAGLVFGYVRMKYGLIYAICLHCAYNVPPVVLLLST